MIAKIVSLLILLPITVVLVVFTVINRGDVPVTLDPFGSIPQLTFDAPLSLLLFCALLVGVSVPSATPRAGQGAPSLRDLAQSARCGVARPRICFGMSFVLAPNLRPMARRQNDRDYIEHALGP